MNQTYAPYGTWRSPISPQMVAADSTRYNDVQWDTDGETLVWSERRDGNTRLIARSANEALRILAGGTLKIGGRVGYGGGDFHVRDGVVVFVADGRLYRQTIESGLPKPITPRFGSAAAPAISPDGEWVAFVHSDEGHDALAIVDSQGKQWPQKLAWGDDFVMQPVWHPSGTQIAYIAWNHPNMPWIGTELRILTLATEGRKMPTVTAEQKLIGDETTAIFQPEYSPDGNYLSYISDGDGYTQIYLYELTNKQHRQLTSGPYEHGTPAWVQGIRCYGWTPDSSGLYFRRNQNGFMTMWSYDLNHDTALPVHDFDVYSELGQISVSPTHEAVALIGSGASQPARILRYSLPTGVEVIDRSTSERLTDLDLADAEAITWTGHDGEMVHGLFYAPSNARFISDGQPPLVVQIHGGPTSQDIARYDLKVQFFTSRGYAVLHANHRGSTGYGKAYMNRHQNNWGVYDVQDAITGVTSLADSGRIDPTKVVIMGGSAGGYTVLQSLIDAPGFYKAGISSYGVADQFALAQDTHKFESRYSEWLLGPLPQSSARWYDRSPLFKAHHIQDALLIFQGSEDKVVPLNQAEQLVKALQQRNIPHEYVVYEGEGHGFRRPETLKDYYQQIEAFLLRYVIFSA